MHHLLSRRTKIFAALVLCATTAAACNGGSSPTAASSPGSTTGGGKHVAAKPTCPLTGKPAATEADAKRPALAIKIDNVAPARPQAGLNSADLVIQEQVEGGLTRLFAVYQCSKAPLIGPIRSARDTDADMLNLLHGSVFGFSGANGSVYDTITKYANTTQVVYDKQPSFFHLDPSRPAPHDVFSSTETLLKQGEAQRHHLKAPPALFTYGDIDKHSFPAHTISMSWPSASATWTWNGKQYLRTQDGTPDVLTGGNTVTSTNVIVMAVKLTYNGLHDVLGNASPDDLVVGSGKAWVFRNGKVIYGRWSRPSAADDWKFTDHKGGVIALNPGRTWIELEAQPQTLHISK